jgi:NADH dehydrogenase
MSKHQICILGGTGFLGHHLVPALAAAGHDILVITRNRERRRDLLVLPTVTIRSANVHDEATLEEAFTDCDVVINLVGIVNERGRDGSGFRQVHADLTRKAVDAAKARGVRRFLHMSALKADAERGPSHYLRTKGEAEAWLRKYAGPELAWTIFRPSMIFGPGDSTTTRLAGLVRWMRLGLPLARPNARLAPVYVADVVQAMCLSLDQPATYGQTYQLCGPQVYSLREFTSLIGAVIDVRPRILALSDGFSRLLAQLLERVPGKPFSMDNYRTLSVHSICEENGFKRLGLAPRSAGTVLPRFLGRASGQYALDRMRRRAAR